MTSPSISTDNGVMQSGTDQASSDLAGSRVGADGRPLPASVDPRLTTAVDDTSTESSRRTDEVDERIDATAEDSQGKTDIDENGSNGIDKIGGALMSALASGASGMLGQVGQLGQGAQMPQMPQVPGASAGQSNNGALSSPGARQALANLLGGDSGALGSNGTVRTASSTANGGPSTPGGTEYEQRIIDLANEVVAAGIPYAWGGGTLEGIGKGIADGGAADAAGDYNKQGFDCSGLTRYLVYQASGVEIPRVSGDQYGAGQLVSAADARPGDLAFDDNPSQHVMMYVGDGKVVEAQRSGTNIMFSDAADRGVTQFVRVVSGG